MRVPVRLEVVIVITASAGPLQSVAVRIGLGDPAVVGLSAFDPTGTVTSSVVFSSPVLTVDPAAAIYYQYHDIEFKPNPDFERWLIISPNAPIIQVVADTVSTVPEPATLSLLTLGSLALLRKRK